MKQPVLVTARIWRPTMAHRLFMLGAAIVYGLILFARPGESAAGWTSYSGVIAIVILALLPGKWRFGLVLTGVLGGLLLAHVVANIVGWPN